MTFLQQIRPRWQPLPRSGDAATRMRYTWPMDVSKILPARPPPQDINVPLDTPPRPAVDEVDKVSGAIRPRPASCSPPPPTPPSAYGFIPGTLAEDGDPADALVLIPAQVVPGAVIRSPPDRHVENGGRGRPGREDHLRAARAGASAITRMLNSIDDLPKDHPRGDRALLRAATRTLNPASG